MRDAVERTPANTTKVEKLGRVIAEALDEALRRGFYGSVAINIAIEDGTIQQISRAVCRKVR